MSSQEQPPNLNPREIQKKFIKKIFNIELYDYQIDFICDCMNLERIIGVFCRQSGKSMCIAIVAILEALRNSNENILLIAPTDLQAGTLFDKVSMYLRNSLLIGEIDTITKRQVILKNGAKILAHTTGEKGDTIRGLTGKVIIMEESAYIKDSIVYEVVTPMGAAKNAKFIKISTPFGMNHFYDSAFKNNWKLHQIPYSIPVKEGLIKQSYIEEQKETTTDIQFRTEYNAEFIADEDAYFKTELIQNCIFDYPLIEVNYAIA